MSNFKLTAPYQPSGDQPQAIRQLFDGLKKGKTPQTLLGVTGSGKTFTMANIIAKYDKPVLVIAHNKTLAAQLAQEYREFFPENAVHYFVSYYDYYQPEAYMAATDTYIEKEAQINEEIERLRHASTQALLTRSDCIIVASVSCIYGLGSPVEYEKVHLAFEQGNKSERAEIVRQLVDIHYERVAGDLTPGTFRALGNAVEIMPIHEKVIFRINLEEGKIDTISEVDAITRELKGERGKVLLFPAKHFITGKDEVERAIQDIKVELAEQLKLLESQGKNLEAERLKRRTNYDLAMIRETGYCNGIENYSRHFSGKKAGDPPDTLLSYFPHTADGRPDFLTIIDESHVTLPQLRAMKNGDAARKQSLVDNGFRLPSARDNRPLDFEEFWQRIGDTIFTSATPAVYEREESQQIVEQIIRPTGLTDPRIDVHPVTGSKTYSGQIKDFIAEAKTAIKKGGRVIATTLTKKMAEDLSQFLDEQGIKASYVHSDIKTIERIEILTAFRRGEFDILVGVNLLREGLDLPEVTLIGILDADKEGFLRSESSLIQIIGRAARNVDGRVILYADTITPSLKTAIGETERRRGIQMAYNKEHGIVPKTIVKKIHDITEQLNLTREKNIRQILDVEKQLLGKTPAKLIKEKEKQMNAAVKVLDFETAALLRDEIGELLKIGEKKKRKPLR